jgi:septal ring factor EnvC (AmiA/AmiB activator)
VAEHDDNHDWETTTAVLARRAPGFAWLPRALRERLTPAALWSAITALAIAVTWLINAQHDIHQLKESSAESQKSVADLRQQLDILHKIDTQLAVMNTKVDGIASEVDRQRQWRERIEDAAEAPPHARRR